MTIVPFLDSQCKVYFKDSQVMRLQLLNLLLSHSFFCFPRWISIHLHVFLIFNLIFIVKSIFFALILKWLTVAKINKSITLIQAKQNALCDTAICTQLYIILSDVFYYSIEIKYYFESYSTGLSSSVNLYIKSRIFTLDQVAAFYPSEMSIHVALTEISACEVNL